MPRTRPGRKFCTECGAPLAAACPTCGASLDGTASASAASAARRSRASRAGSCASRRRLRPPSAGSSRCSSPTWSASRRPPEARDAEETRELLSRYFDTAQRLIERYGGTVEKFIGDAVMAVWGTPVANEDDAERAVRAALDLVAAVPELDPALAARAGVLTGEAAVTLGAEGQGMVAGDLVNTASRIQSAAEPGTVLVGEATKRATEAAIAYEDGGRARAEGEGRADARSAGRCACSAARGGAQRSAGLEPPFVGRDRELRLVKELFHASAEERKAHLVSVTGIAGIGKSRLAWEFEKYIDGLVEEVWWHRGRCLAYGEGVAYWALAEMVRMRARIGEDEATATALRQAPRRRRAARPRPRGARLDRAAARPAARARRARRRASGRTCSPPGGSSSSGWPTQGPCVLVFEDIQWADAGAARLRRAPARVVAEPPDLRARARPARGRLERSTGLGRATRRRSRSSRSPSRRWRPCWTGSCRACPASSAPRSSPERKASRSTRSRPCGCCSTAACSSARATRTARPGRSRSSTCRRRCTRSLAARLDGLTPEERRDRRRTRPCSGRRSRSRASPRSPGRDEDDVETLLSDLIRKEVLTLQADPRSPERGQYALPPGPAEARRLRDPLEGRAEGAPPRRGTPHLDGMGGRGDRRDRRRALPGGVPARPRGRRRRRDQGHGPGRARPCRRARGVARRDRRGRRYLRAGRRARRRPARGGAAARAGRALGLQRRRHGGRQARAGAVEGALCGSRGRRARRPLVEAAVANTEWQLHQADQALERLQAAYAVLVEGERGRGVRRGRRRAGARASSSWATSRAPSARSTPRSRRPSGSGCPRRSRRG